VPQQKETGYRLAFRERITNKKESKTMATIVKSIDSATELRDEFAAYDRDYYPFAVYEALIDFFDECYTEESPFQLDVIGLCCDIQQIDEDDLEDDAIDEDDYDEDGNADEDAVIAALEEKASEQGCFLWAGIEDGKPVAYYI
jgi:hypothetical protein